jgi:hypothetical protein
MPWTLVLDPGTTHLHWRPVGEDPWGWRAHWGRPAADERGRAREVLLRVEYRGVRGAAQEVEAFAILGDYAVRMPIERSDDRVAVDHLELHRRDGEPFRAQDFALLGQGAIYTALARAMQHPFIVEHLGDGWGAVMVPRPGRRGRDDLYYAAAALGYVRALEAGHGQPVRWMVEQSTAEGEHVTADEVRARLRRARERGLLTSAPAGRAGGELTDKAVGLLRAAGLLNEGDDDHGQR